MYFWNTTALEKDLKKGLSEKENMKYLLLMMAFFALATFPVAFEPNAYDYFIAVFIVFATVGEVLFLYKLNKSEKGKNFLSRYLSIGLVAFVRSLLFIALPLIILLILTVAILDPAYNEMNTGIVDVVFVVVYYVGYIFLQAQSFKRVNA